MKKNFDSYSLPSGEELKLYSTKKLQLEFWGVVGVDTGEPLFSKEEYLKFRESMMEAVQEVVNTNLESGDSTKKYDPVTPHGKANELLSAVKKALYDIGEETRSLKLYNTIGTRVGFFHGISGFFLWRGIYVTIDISTIKKKHGSPIDEENLRANFLIGSDDMLPGGFRKLGKKIALKLITERKQLISKIQSRFK